MGMMVCVLAFWMLSGQLNVGRLDMSTPSITQTSSFSSPAMIAQGGSGRGSMATTTQPPDPHHSPGSKGGSPDPAKTSTNSGSDSAAMPVALISAVAALIAAIIAGVVGLRAANTAFAAAERTLWQKTNDDELKMLQKSLDEFYGPFLHISKSSDLMARDLRDRVKTPGYRMLLALMHDGWLESLSMSDRAIVEDVCANGARLEKMIYEHAGVVDEVLFEYLGRASVHFRMLNRALKKELGSDQKNLKLYVFPDHLTQVIEFKVRAIKARCQHLREHPGGASQPAQELVIPNEWRLPDWPSPERTAESATTT